MPARESDGSVVNAAVGRRGALQQRALEDPVLALEQRALEAMLDGVEDLRDAKRFQDEVARAGTQRLDRGVEVGVGGDQHHLAGKTEFAQLAQPGDAALAGQRDVEDHQVEAMPAHQPVGLFGAAGHQRMAHARRQRLEQEVAHARFVIDDQHGGMRPTLAAEWMGFGRGAHGSGHCKNCAQAATCGPAVAVRATSCRSATRGAPDCPVQRAEP